MSHSMEAIENLTTTNYEDCDWEEASCPVCGRSYATHDTAALTRCAIDSRRRT